MNKYISILLTTYNCGDFIYECISSVLRQTYPYYELIVIDDGSTDNTSRVISGFKDDRIIYKKIEHIGRSRALNIGLRLCKHDWIAIIDADDIWHPQKLAKQSEYLNSGNDVVLTNAVFFKDNEVKYFIDSTSEKKTLKQILKLHGHITNSSAVFKRSEITLYNENLKNAEDYEFWLRLIGSYNFIVVPEFLTFVRIRENSLSRSDIYNRNKIVYAIQEEFYTRESSLFDEYSGREKLMLLGWREFFYGSKSRARRFWIQLNVYLIRQPKIAAAYMMTFLNESYFRKIVEFKLRYYLQAFMNYKTVKYLKSDFLQIRAELNTESR